MELELTQEQIQQQISAAFDSVNLINELDVIENLTLEQEGIKVRNQQHLEIMMGKEYFTQALTTQQETDIQAVL